jgi:hypothetical protein
MRNLGTWTVTVATAVATTVAVATAATTLGARLVAGALDSGQRQLGQNLVEPAYDGLDGSSAYLLTPLNAPAPLDGQITAPLYVVVYPAAVAGTIGVVNCQHQPMDNCPDHGPAIAGLAEAGQPAVYASGIWGHDHLVTEPAANGGAFRIARLPVAVLFTNLAAAAHHIVTIAQLNEALAAGDVTTMALPGATLHGSSVSEATYDRAMPVPPVAPLP